MIWDAFECAQLFVDYLSGVALELFQCKVFSSENCDGKEKLLDGPTNFNFIPKSFRCCTQFVKD